MKRSRKQRTLNKNRDKKPQRTFKKKSKRRSLKENRRNVQKRTRRKHIREQKRTSKKRRHKLYGGENDGPELLVNNISNVDGYNELMGKFKDESVNVEDTLTLNSGDDRIIALLDDLDLNTAIRNIREIICNSHLSCGKLDNEDAVAKLKEKPIEEDDITLNVGTNGMISELLNIIVNLEDSEGQEMDKLAKSLIVASLKDDDQKFIFTETNGFTARKRHYNIKQSIMEEEDWNAELFPFTQGNADAGEETDKVNILTWVIMTVPLLQFFVPPNCMDGRVYSSKDLLHNVKKGLKFYGYLRKYLGSTGGDSTMEKILYADYKPEIILGDILEEEEFKDAVCGLSRFPFEDGFDGKTEPIRGQEIESANQQIVPSSPDHFQNETFSQINHCEFGHRYLDSRHLLTIMYGSREKGEYHINLRKPIIKLLNNTDQPVPNKLQLFSRVKLAIYEGLKLNFNCRKGIENWFNGSGRELLKITKENSKEEGFEKISKEEGFEKIKKAYERLNMPEKKVPLIFYQYQYYQLYDIFTKELTGTTVHGEINFSNLFGNRMKPKTNNPLTLQDFFNVGEWDNDEDNDYGNIIIEVLGIWGLIEQEMQTHREDITLFNKSINLKTPEVKTWLEIKDPDNLKGDFDLYYKNRYSISNYRVNKEIEDQLDGIDNNLNCDGNNPKKVLDEHRKSEKKTLVKINEYEFYDEKWKAEIQMDLKKFWSLEDMSDVDKVTHKDFLMEPEIKAQKSKKNSMILFNNISKLIKDKILLQVSTNGNGNCGFHSILYGLINYYKNQKIDDPFFKNEELTNLFKYVFGEDDPDIDIDNLVRNISYENGDYNDEHGQLGFKDYIIFRFRIYIIFELEETEHTELPIFKVIKEGGGNANTTVQKIEDKLQEKDKNWWSKWEGEEKNEIVGFIIDNEPYLRDRYKKKFKLDLFGYHTRGLNEYKYTNSSEVYKNEGNFYNFYIKVHYLINILQQDNNNDDDIYVINEDDVKLTKQSINKAFKNMLNIEKIDGELNSAGLLDRKALFQKIASMQETNYVSDVDKVHTGNEMEGAPWMDFGDLYMVDICKYFNVIICIYMINAKSVFLLDPTSREEESNFKNTIFIKNDGSHFTFLENTCFNSENRQNIIMGLLKQKSLNTENNTENLNPAPEPAPAPAPKPAPPPAAAAPTPAAAAPVDDLSGDVEAKRTAATLIAARAVAAAAISASSKKSLAKMKKVVKDAKGREKHAESNLRSFTKQLKSLSNKNLAEDKGGEWMEHSKTQESIEHDASLLSPLNYEAAQPEGGGSGGGPEQLKAEMENEMVSIQGLWTELQLRKKHDEKDVDGAEKELEDVLPKIKGRINEIKKNQNKFTGNIFEHLENDEGNRWIPKVGENLHPPILIMQIIKPGEIKEEIKNYNECIGLINQSAPELYLVPIDDEDVKCPYYGDDPDKVNKVPSARIIPDNKDSLDKMKSNIKKGFDHLYFIIDYYETNDDESDWILLYSTLFGESDRVFWMKWDNSSTTIVDIFLDKYSDLNTLKDKLEKTEVGSIKDKLESLKTSIKEGSPDEGLENKVKSFKDNMIAMNEILYWVKKMVFGWANIKQFINEKISRIIKPPTGPGKDLALLPQEYEHYFRCRWIPLMVTADPVKSLIDEYHSALISKAAKDLINLESHHLLSVEDYSNYLYNILWTLVKNSSKGKNKEIVEDLEKAITRLYIKGHQAGSVSDDSSEKYLLKIFNYINPVINAIDYNSLVKAMDGDDLEPAPDAG